MPLGRPVQLSIGLVSFAAEAPADWNHLAEQARVFDRCGIDRLVVSDHVVFGMNMDTYARPETGGRAGGRQPTGPDGQWLEPLTTLAYIAAHTNRIRLGTNVLLAALRPAAVLAKTASTLDVLSGGRLDLGVGVGWQKEEYDAVGLGFDDRGRILDRVLDVCQRLWTRPEVSYETADLRFDRIHQMPKPVQPGGIPIWVSGTVNPHVVRRLVKFGAGWIPWGEAADDLPEGIRQMRAEVKNSGGDPDGFGVVGTLRLAYDRDNGLDVITMAHRAAELAQAGVTDVRLSHWPVGLGEGTLAPLVAAIKEATRSVTGGHPE